MKKLNMAIVADGRIWGLKRSVAAHQTAVFVMCGGGTLGELAAQQPADFYIDQRVGRLPFSRGAILQAVGVLATIAIKNGLDPHDMPPRPKFHACGIF